MKLVSLDERLSAIARLVRKDSPVCDIGTDHALLPCYLKQRGQRLVIASDINENPLKQALDTMNSYNIEDVELILSDGLKNIPCHPDMDFIIAGMGGETIGKIIGEYTSPTNTQRFILQPMTRHYETRRSLYENGYEILSETAVNTGKRHYTIIYAMYDGLKKEITPEFAFIGKQTDREYIKFELLKLRKMANKDKTLLKIIKEIEDRYDCC